MQFWEENSSSAKNFNDMQYVYILKSKKDNSLYTGCTNDIKSRVTFHNSGKVFSTKERKPYEIIFYEAFVNKYDAYRREKWLKTGWGRNHIKNMLSDTCLKNLRIES